MNILQPYQPTMCAVMPDGQYIYTLCWPLHHVMPHAAIPGFYIETGEYEYIDRDMALIFQACGTFGDAYSVGGKIMFERIGVHIPGDAAREIADWSEEWLRRNPDVHCIPGSSIAYQRNTYTTTKTSLLTRNQWVEMYEHFAQQLDPGRRTQIPGGARDQSPNPGTARTRGAQSGQRRAGP